MNFLKKKKPEEESSPVMALRLGIIPENQLELAPDGTPLFRVTLKTIGLRSEEIAKLARCIDGDGLIAMYVREPARGK